MREVAVPLRLARFVRTARLYPGSAPGDRRYRRLPDGETELLVRFGGNENSASVVGTRTHVLRKPSTQACEGTLVVRFRLGGAHPFFGRPLSELTDGVIPLGSVWTQEQCAELVAADSGERVTRATFDALTHTLERDDAYDPAVARAVRRALHRIEALPSLPAVPQLAAEIGMSERQLRRGFGHVIGLSPKRYLRIVRFRRALRAARQTTQPSWSAIAEQHGYFDQAHLIADFRELSGETPTNLVD